MWIATHIKMRDNADIRIIYGLESVPTLIRTFIRQEQCGKNSQLPSVVIEQIFFSKEFATS